MINTMEIREIVNLEVGEVKLYLPGNKESIKKARKLLDLLEEYTCGLDIRPIEPQGSPQTSEKVQTPGQPIESPPDEAHGVPASIQAVLNPFELIPKFVWDKSKEKSYRTIFFVECEDGRVGISYFASKVFTTKEAIMAIPYPIPQGYAPLKTMNASQRAAIGKYQEYLACEAPRQEVIGAGELAKVGKDAAEKIKEALRLKAEVNAQRWQSPKPQKEMSDRTKQLRDNVVAKINLSTVG